MDEEKLVERLVAAVSRALAPEFAKLSVRMDASEQKLELRMVQLERHLETFEKDWRTIHYGFHRLQGEIAALRVLVDRAFEDRSLSDVYERRFEEMERRLGELAERKAAGG